MQNLSLTLATFIVFFGLGEIALRATGIDRGSPKTPAIYEASSDPAISYQLKPNLKEYAFRSTVTTNSLGMRSPEPDNAKKTIMMLGDSITFGYGVEDDETVGSKLSALLDHQYNVMTIAAPGYTLGQESSLFLQKSPQISTDTLILVFYWNDLADEGAPPVLASDGNLHEPGWKPTEIRCHPIEEGILGYLPGRCFLDLHSAFYRTVKKLIVRNTEQKNMKAQMQEAKKNPSEDNVTEEQIQRYAAELSSFSKKLPTGMHKLFVIWPEKTFHQKTLPKITAAAERNGFTVLNLYQTFGNEMETLSWDTVHPSAASIAKAAELIKIELEKNDLLP